MKLLDRASLFFVFLAAINIQAQTYEITFTGSGESTMVDHVQVVNLNRGDTLDIDGTDVLKLVVGATNIVIPREEENKLVFYPNPMRGEGRFQFYTSVAGFINIEIFDITGRLLIRKNYELESGNQTFSLTGLNTGLYTLRASTPEARFSTRIISVEENKEIPVLRHEYSEFVSKTPNKLKSSQAVVEMGYANGERILLKGISGNYQRIVTIAPVTNQVVNFEFVACTDYDNNHYPVVTIGNQTWMAENLITGHFNDGTEIMLLEPDALWIAAEIPAYCWVHNDEENYGFYGKLYNWHVAGGENNPCPEGWYVPGYYDWMTLSNYLIAFGYNWDGSTTGNNAGKSLAHIDLWQPYATEGTVGNQPFLNNRTGFTLLSNGRREAYAHEEGTFRLQQRYSFNWLSTEYPDMPDRAWHFLVKNDGRRHEEWGMDKKRGAGIRCIKEASPVQGDSIVFPAGEWLASSPEQQNVSSVKMMEALNFLEASVNYNGIDEVMVIRNGYVIFEGSNTSRTHDIASASKTFTSTVLGLLVDEGSISLNDYAANYESLLNEKYPGVSFRHFTTMTSGYNAVGKNRWDGVSEDWSWTPYDPDEPFFAPGTEYAYWDEAQMMFGRVLTKILNRTMESYLKEKIANNIGMPFTWDTEGDLAGLAINNGCTGIRINARSLARWGWLFLNEGNWDGEQLISKEWVNAATSVQVPSSVPVADTDRANLVGPGCYGYNWWVNGEKADGNFKLPGAPEGMYFASGANNNRCFVIPEWNMVIVRMGTDGNIDNADIVYGQFLEKMEEAILDLDEEIEISFTASGATSTVEDIMVVYLSKGDTVDISGTDVLKLVKSSESAKKNQSSVELPYTDGDWILLKGKSGNYQRIVTIAPTESGTVDFEFVACTDYNGNNYPAVTIGTQTWMAENLRTGSFNDGTEIMYIEADALWEAAEIPAYSFYNNDVTNNAVFGKLYNWLAAGGEKNPCPAGWHVPSHGDYMVLHNYLIDNGYNVPPDRTDNTDNTGWSGKAISHIHSWKSHTRDGAIGNDLSLNNRSGFSALPNGSRRDNGTFTNPGEWAFLWLSTEDNNDPNKAHNYLYRYDYGRHENWTEGKKRGMAIRCIKD